MRTVAKVLHFPFAGVSRSLSVRDSTQPSETRTYGTPLALNVRGDCVFADRHRGGSRPAALVLKERSASVETDFRARLVYADGSLWFASRAGDVTDFNMGGDGEDPTRPASGNAALSGHSGENITALFTTDGQTLYMATAQALWIMRGDVTDGSFSLLSPVVGCVSQDAWAWDGVRLFVLSAQGLYSFAAGESPRRISADIPQELQNCTWATITYDRDLDALNITSDKGNWSYEIEHDAWWPFNSSDTSYVAIGPFRTSGRDDQDGMLDTLQVALANSSAGISLEVYSARTAEDALVKAEYGLGGTVDPQYSTLVGGGFNYVLRPRVRGAWCVIVLRGTSAWAYESMTATCKQLGRLR